MEKYNVIIFIEHLARELDAALLLKLSLEKRGFSVLIKSIFYDYYYVCRNCECDVLVVPYCYNNKDFLLFSHVKSKAILNLHHEQIDTINSNKLLPVDKAKNTYHISWGSIFTKELVLCGVQKEAIFQTGSVRSDFLNDYFKGLVMSKKDLGEKYNLSADKKWVLIAGNFSKIYFVDENKEKPRYEISKEAIKTYRIIMGWLKEILKSLPEDYEVIYRPHPTESFSREISTLEKENRNFHFIRNENISDWVSNSDSVFVYRSTSAIDGLLSNKPTFLLRPFVLDSKYELPILEKMVKINNLSSFNDAIIGKKNYLNCTLLDELFSRYDINDGKSYIKIIDAISIIIGKENDFNYLSHYSLKDDFRLRIKEFAKRHLVVINKMGLLKKYENFQYDKIDQTLVNKRLSLIESVIGNKKEGL